MAALAEFHAEKDAHEKTFEKLRTGAAPRAGAGLGVVEPEDEDPVAEDADDQPLSMAAFTEDWNESQFWVRKTTCTKQGTRRSSHPVVFHLFALAVEIDGIAIGFWDRVCAIACLKLGYLLRTWLVLALQLHDIYIVERNTNMGLTI